MSQAAPAAAEKGRPSSSSSTPALIASSELDPLLKDLSEKKQSFRRRIMSLAAELKDVRSRLTSQEESFARETLSRQLAEKRANTMQEEICRLQRNQEEKKLQAALSSAEQLAEKRVKTMEEEICRLQGSLKEKDGQLQASTDSAEQLEKHCRADQELKKRVVKLKFCLRKTPAQTQKLQRMDVKREKVLKELRDHLAMKERNDGGCHDKRKFWESSGFKMIISILFLVLVVFAKH